MFGGGFESGLSELSHTQLVLVVTANICTICNQETDSSQETAKPVYQSK